MFFNSRTSRILGRAAALAGLVVTPVALGGSAAAHHINSDCFPDDESFFTDTYYTTSGSNYYLDYMTFILDENDHEKSNVKLKVASPVSGGGRTWYGYTSADNIHGETTYRKDPNKYIPRTANPWVENWVNADQGVDTACYTDRKYFSTYDR